MTTITSGVSSTPTATGTSTGRAEQRDSGPGRVNIRYPGPLSIGMPTDTTKIEGEAELLDLLVRQSIGSSKSSLAAALALFTVFGSYGLNGGLILWVLAVLLVSGSRVYLMSARFRPPRSGRRNWNCYRVHYWTGLGSAASWGSLAFVPTTGLPVYSQSLSWAIPILVGATAVSSYSIVIRHYRDYLIVLAACVVTGSFVQHGIDALSSTIAFSLFAPVIFITGRRYHRNLVDAHAARMAASNALVELQAANENLLEQRNIILQEEQIAAHVFATLTQHSRDDIPGIRTWNDPMGKLSGDLILVATGPNNQSYVFLGDFTGHGLPAALGAVPAAHIFSAMAAKGLAVRTIVSELNAKLYRMLPTGYFCCAAVLEISEDQHHLTVWNGGLPPMRIRWADTGEITEVPSGNLPLGVAPLGDWSVTDWTLGSGDCVYLYSDGLVEATGANGEMWGEGRLLALLERADLRPPLLGELRSQLLEFTGREPSSDNISVVEIHVGEAASLSKSA